MFTYLIIDDEELTRKGTIKKLAPMEASVRCIGEAENGVEGIEKIRTLCPDIVVLDMQMPVMDGTELLPYLSGHFPQIPLIVISGYQNFDYIKHAMSAHAIDYILKPFSREDIQKCMRSAINRLINENAIESRLQNTEEEKENALYEVDLQVLKGLLFGFHHDDVRLSSGKLALLNQQCLTSVLTVCPEHKIEQDQLAEWKENRAPGQPIIFLADQNDPLITYVLLFMLQNKPGITDIYLVRTVRDLLEFLEQQGNTALIGISKIHDSLKELNKAFRESGQALNSQLLTDTPPMYYLPSEAAARVMTWDRQDEFLFRIESGSASEVSALTDALFDEFGKIRDLTLSDAKYQCYVLGGECRRILSGYIGQTGIENDSHSIQNVTNHIYRLADLKKYYLQYFENVASLLREKTVYAQDDVIENVRIYIERNYQKNLTQDFVAYLFCINRSYLSTLFKSRTGEKFVDYLNNIRIEKAKELLVSSDRKLYHIAKAVGYDNVKYFFRVFKKKVGMTPEEYRNSRSAHQTTM